LPDASHQSEDAIDDIPGGGGREVEILIVDILLGGDLQ
jgi:hypothetical protein